ncbi:serine hydrolase [Modestobacter sp. SSW1-42]|uniref:serine hydrolase n=1 Tax=Modestobacter sp. SSW1-42 TaxID=596372 RepID=UPI0039863EDF
MTAPAPPASRGRRGRWRRPGGLAVSSALVATLLVGPVVCLGESAPARASEVAAPVPRELREFVGTWVPPVRVDAPALLAQVAAAAGPAEASVEVVVLDAAGRTLLATPTADRPVLSASLVKVLVAQQLLAREAAGVVELGPSDVPRLERAVTASDDPATSQLWDLHDGAALVTSAAASFGLTGTAPPDRAGQWGESVTTAADVARFLAALAEDPGAPGAAAVLDWMRAATPVAADGFDQRFGLLAGGTPPGTAVKQGWMCCVAGQRQLHSAGVLPDGRVVVVLAEAPTATSWAALVRAVDEATAALVAGTAA